MAGARQLGSKYLLGEQLGRGAMGVVYDATTTDGAAMAVKLLRPELASDDKTVARFVQERQIFRRIEHPNVVRVDDLVAEGDQLGIAMEKVSGGDLRQRADGRSLAPSVSMRIAADVASGLEAIHAADVVHRDLKPANILIAETADGLQPKISDFGISRLVSETMTRTSTTIGTPLYMAPEAADKRGADAPADVYALGAIMFELLIGNAPFTEGGTFAVLRAHAQDVPPFVDGVPGPLAELIDQMLAKEPGARPTATEVNRRLVAILPTIDDRSIPVAIERGPDVGPVSTADTIVAAEAPGADGPLGAGPVPAARPDLGPTPGPPVDRSGETIVAPGPLVDSPPPAAAAPAVDESSETIVTPLPPVEPRPPAPPVPIEPSATAEEPLRVVAAPSVGGGVLDQRSRRLAQAALAVASVLALVAIGVFALTRGGDDDANAIGSENSTPVEVDGGADGDGTTSDGETAGELDGSGGSDDDGQGIFDGDRTDTTDPDAPTTETTATTAATGSTTTSPGSTTTSSTASTGSTTSTTEATTTTSTVSTTTSITTSTTSSTTTSTTTPAAVPIRIVSGPVVNTVGRTSFQFNYTTNDVCGTGSFTVVDRDSGVVKGSFTGDNVCFGPLHGGFPQDSHPVFGGYNLEPGTTYVVNITVRGTASDGTRTAGSGSDSTSFTVTTAS